MTPPLSTFLLLGSAKFLLGYQDERPGRGQLVRLMLAEVGLQADAPWGLAYISYAGYRSHGSDDMRQSSWPLPRTGIAEDLAAFARERSIVYPTPEKGDIALFGSRRARGAIRAGIVAEVIALGKRAGDEFRITTIEGDVTPHGVAGGRGVFLVKRTIRRGSPSVFVRWRLLDARGAVSDPAAPTRMEMGRLVIDRVAS